MTREWVTNVSHVEHDTCASLARARRRRARSDMSHARASPASGAREVGGRARGRGRASRARATASRAKSGADGAHSTARDFVHIRNVCYSPAGAGRDILRDVNLSLPRKGLTLIVGRSGSGKSTLMTILAGLSEPTSGVVALGADETRASTPSAERLAQVGIVFQFPERHFLGTTMLQELTFAWPQTQNGFTKRRELAYRMNDALHAVGMERIPLDTDVRALSGGYKRRLALAIQLVRDPAVLCLDEPLAGLDWQTRAEVTALLNDLKRDRAVVVVSHDVEEISPITDRAYRMENMGALTDVSDELAGARASAFGAAADSFASFD